MFRVWKERFGMDEDYFTHTNLQRLNLKTLHCLVQEMKTEVQKISQHLVHSLVERDKIAKRHEDKLEHVSELLSKYAEANGLKTNIKFYLKYTSYYNESEYRKWRRSWSIVAQIGRGIVSDWRHRVWEGVVMYSTKDIQWDRVLHHLAHDKIVSSREREWRNGIEQSLKHLNLPQFVDNSALERVLLSYSQLFPESVFCLEFTTLTATSLAMVNDEELALKVLVTLLEHKLPPQYFAEGFHSVKSDILVLNDLIDHYLPQLSSHMQSLRSSSIPQVFKSYSSKNPPGGDECRAFEPPLVDALSLQWLLSCFTLCLPWKTVRRVFDSLLIDGSEILVFTMLAIWTLMESELLQVKNVPDFYTKASHLVEQLKKGTLISPTDFIQIIYTLKHCAHEDEGMAVKKLRKKHASAKTRQQRSTPLCPPPSQGGSLTMSPLYPPPAVVPSPTEIDLQLKPITALAECPQTKKSGFMFSYAYAADVPVELPVKYALRMSRNCNQLLKNGTIFNMGDYCEADSTQHLFNSSSVN